LFGIERKKLQRNPAPKTQVFGFEDLAHSATAETMQNAVMRDDRADQVCCRGTHWGRIGVTKT
jgi:hypothetical protein